MFLPISDAPNPRGVPFATWSLIGANVALYLFVSLPLGMRPVDLRDPALPEYVQLVARQMGGRVDVRQIIGQTSAYNLFVFKHGYRPAHPSVSDLFFSMFLHGGFMHLFGNMLFLWIYGDNVERRLGVAPYVFWYLATGAAGTLSFSLVSSTPEAPLVGASGAISGILGFYFVWFPRNVVRVLFFLPPFFFTTFQIPARIVLGVFLLLDNVLPLLVAGESGVAHGAHIGGFLAGAAVAWVLEQRGLKARPRGLEKPAEKPSEAGVIHAALADGRYGEAASDYFALPAARARGLLSAPEAAALARWLRAQGHSDAALALLRRVVRDVPRGEGLAEAYALAGTILHEDLGEATAAYQYLLAALDLGASPETVVSVRQQLAAIEEGQKRRVGRPYRPPSW
jgi:membrane associated rhomboid family serine protease